MTTIRNKETKKEEKIPHENFYFNDFEEILLTDQETQDLEKNLGNIEINIKTRSFFKSAHQFYKKLALNKFTISLEDIEKL